MNRIVKALLALICMAYTFCGYAQPAKKTSLSKQETDTLVTELGSMVKQYYFNSNKANALNNMLLKKLKAGMFYNHDEDSLTQKLSLMLRQETNDLHFYVGHKRMLQPDASTSGQPARQQVNLNGGFTEVRLLENNIGYIKWEHFIADEEAFKKIINAFNFLSGCGALIIDISKNPGGDGRSGGFVNQHLYRDLKYQNVLLKKCGGEQEWHQSEVPYNYTDGAKFFDTPLYIIVSGNTASAAEYFTLIAQEMNRATILGKTTAGAGNPCTIIPFRNYFLQVPICEIKTEDGKSIEAKGVLPDVELKSVNWVNETIEYINRQEHNK